MNDAEKRAQRVIQMRLAGASEMEIAITLRMQREQIRKILNQPEDAIILAKRFEQLLAEIRQADDLDKKWPVVDLVDSLALSTMVTNALVNHFECRQSEGVSLRELMDLAISFDSRGECLVSPFLDVRCGGVKGFWLLVIALTKLHLGECCHHEWSKRLERLRNCRRIRGASRYSWSKPCEPPVEFLEIQRGYFN